MVVVGLLTRHVAGVRLLLTGYVMEVAVEVEVHVVVVSWLTEHVMGARLMLTENVVEVNLVLSVFGVDVGMVSNLHVGVTLAVGVMGMGMVLTVYVVRVELK